ncbi:hypothetical protein CRE_28106 [Caenorhabditis remanei]|uniref:Chitin-binding type-2 domain-containing protein n=1 Tax=Caenorhabditis remanei TaxID=31234 RepID=E3LMC4_CAERE|nr:hypothetical protein CRE_28106 [Caenorhabditis remanei]
MGPKLATVSLVLLTLFTNSLQQSPYSSSTPECPAYYSGSIAGNSCSQEYSICVDGIRQAAKCSEGFVFYETGCIPTEDSPECQLADDTEEEPYEHFDCSSRNDGLYSLGCINQFVNCVAGQAYQMYCPDDLVFNGKTQDCQESCDDVEEDVITTTSAAYKSDDDSEGYDEGSGENEGYYEPQPTPEQPDTVDFDCNGLENKNYANGCSDIFYTCTNNVAFKRYCPQGTVFNPNQQVCDYDCTTTVITTTQQYVSTTNADVPSTTASTTSEYKTTQEDPSVYTSTQNDQNDFTTRTTASYETTPGFDNTVPIASTTTQTAIICQEGQVTTFGMCSSRFDRCQNNSVRSKQCPVNTLFESSLVLCVFDLPQCQPITVPSTPTYNFYGGAPSDTIVSPFDENVRLKPKFNRRPSYNYGPVGRPVYGNQQMENPFFIPRHRPYGGDRQRSYRRRHSGPVVDSPFSTWMRGRAALNDQFKDYRRARSGKIQYGEARKVEGSKRFILDDEFDGPKAKFVESSIQQIFPEDRHSKKTLGPEEDPDGYKDDKTFDAKDLFGATRRKRSAYYGSQQSGYGQHTAQISSRQAQVNKDCQQYNTPTFLTFGDCFDQFIYCSGNGINRMAACPIGETFNKALRACSETCGVSTPVVTVTVGTTQTSDDSVSSSSSYDGISYATTVPSSYEAYTTDTPSRDLEYTTAPWDEQSDSTSQSWIDQQSTTAAPIGSRCSSVPSGLFSIGCSNKYIQCSNGAAIVRSCGGNLFFDQEKQGCDYKDQVPECDRQEITTYSPIVTQPADDETTYSHGEPPKDIQTTTISSVGDQCAYVSSGLYSIGCSQKYIMCSNGAAITRSCDGNLYFNKAKRACSSKEQVLECSIATVSSDDQPTDLYGSPSDDTPATTLNPVGDRCAYVPSGLFAIGCSQRYIQCSNGVATVRSCSASLYFDQGSESCTFRNQVPECQSNDLSTTDSSRDETTTSGYGYTDEYSYQQSSTAVSEEQSSTTAGYDSTNNSKDQPRTYAPSVVPYDPSAPEKEMDEPEDACAGLSDGSHGQGCSSSFIICSYGRLVNSVTCPLGQGYDPSVQYCRTFSQIPPQACDQEKTTTDAGLAQPLPYATLEGVLSTTQPTTTTIGNDEADVSYTTDNSEGYTTTASYEEESSDVTTYGESTTPTEDTTTEFASDSYTRADDSEEEEDGYEQKCTLGSRASTGFCVQAYLECTATGFAEKSCRVGKLFDTHANRCVPRIACGKEAIRDAIKDVIATTNAPTKKFDGRCAHIEGDGVFALGTCSSNYVLCSYGSAKLQHCAGNQVFSNAKSECVSRDSTSECNVSLNPPVKSYYNNHDQSAYCDGKADGLYGNKRDCSAILQCFGGELFEHPSCPSNLAFNELTGKCDYPQKVSGCENHGRTDGVCTEHGSFIADVNNCSVFYRCVWGRKVVMRCPSGTVFNPALSVCDWPSAVPSCGGSSTDNHSSYGASSYNDDNSGY